MSTKHSDFTDTLSHIHKLSPFSDLSRKQAIISTLALVGALIALLGSALYYFTKPSPLPMEDPLLARVILKVSRDQSYFQHIETETVVSGRNMRVTGDYAVNHQYEEYSSRATTTLSIPEDDGSKSNHSFTLSNIAIKSDVYSKIETDSDLLKKTIPHSPTWRHFRDGEIPQELINIAIPGPIMDNLKILTEEGKYLLVVRKDGLETINGQNLSKYILKLSDTTPEIGTLGSILNRIGKEGQIYLWIDQENAEPQIMSFHNDSYHSTTSISMIGNVPRTSPPL